ncbi:MAG TPA: ABC transporter permease [Clostridiaceae bacterium]|nr:ABC transporter permease [Clostridiaceae bacterium]
MNAIFKKELKSYFYSPIAYVLIGLFLLVGSILFFVFNLASAYADTRWIFMNGIFILVLMIFSSVLTMRILAEDRKNGSEVLLLTSPVNIVSIVVGKYLAALVVFLIMTAITFVYPLITFAFDAQFTAEIIGGYIGFILLGASFLSVGVFASSLTENQVVAVITSFVMLLIMWIISGVSGYLGGTLAKVLNWISLLSRYDDFNRGILNFGSIVYYLSFIFVMLFLTVRVIEKRRWSQG